MRNKALWLMGALLIVGLIVVGVGLAGPPDDREGPPGPGGRGEPSPGFQDRPGPGRGFPPGAGEGFGPPGRFGPPGGLERVLDDLSGKKKETAEAALKAYQESVRKLTEPARADLLQKMREVLSDREYRGFKDALERQPVPPLVAARPGVTAEEMVERIMAFDKNKDGLVSREELPERMQDLITRGDTNKDGFLDKEEIWKLATDGPRDGGFPGFGPPGFGPGGPPLGPPEPGTVLPPPVRARLGLTDDQEKQLADLEKEVKAKLMKVLTDEQKKQLQELGPRGPGGPPFGGPGRNRPPGRGERP